MASVSTLDKYPKDKAFKNWKNDGVYFVENARTKQKMPHYFQFYQDYENNKDRFDVEKACKNLKIPSLFVHGSNNESVTIHHSENLHSWTKNSKLKIIENAAHTFGAKEPWEDVFLPKELDEAIGKIIDFIKEKTS